MVLFAAQTSVSFMAIKFKRALQNKKEIFADKQILYAFLSRVFLIDCHQWRVSCSMLHYVRITSAWHKCPEWQARARVTPFQCIEPPVYGQGMCIWSCYARSLVCRHSLCEHLIFFPSSSPSPVRFCFYVIVIMAFFCSHLYWAEYVSDRNCKILIHRKLIFNYELFIKLFHAEFGEFYNRKWPILFQTS